MSDVRRAAPSTALDSTTQLPRQVDALLSEDEPLIRPNIGRHVLPRMEPDQPSSDAENVLSATVPALSGALRAAGLTAIPREVQAASDFVSSVVERVGPVDLAGEVPREVRRLRWSVFNVPLMWAAAAGDDSCAVLGWLSARAVSLPPMFVDGVQVSALEALHIGWHVSCDTMRSWGVSSREDFAEWMHRSVFVRPRWGAHFSGKIQERILNAVVVRDVRGTALESFYVHLVMQACSSEGAAAPPEVGPRATADRAPAVGETQWNCLDDIQLQEMFQMRFRVLQSCPAHLKAKYRVALTTALEAVHEAAQRRDPVKEVRAWKLFSFVAVLVASQTSG